MSPFGIEPDEVACDILDLLLRALLKAFPCPCTEMRQTWRLACSGAAVFAYLVERMDGYIYLVIVLVYDAYDLLIAVADRYADKSCEFPYAVVHMYNIISRLHLLQLFHGQCHLTLTCLV